MSTVDMLWTGGLDSTFRLLQAILLEKKTVQPYYIIDHSRKSMTKEIMTMKKIREGLESRVSEGALLPTKTYFRWEIKPNSEITQSYQALRKAFRIGTQYEWLARFSEEHSLNRLELGLQAYEDISYSKFREFLEADIEGVGSEAKLKESANSNLRIFRNYRFPIIHITKPEMIKISVENGFDDLLFETWFCHKPIFGTSCGYCRPCQISKTTNKHHAVKYSKLGYIIGLPYYLGLKK